MTLPLRKIENPLVLGSQSGRATLYFPSVDAEVDVIAGFDIDGYKDLALQSVHRAYSRGEWGPDFLAELDEDQRADLTYHLCLQISWKQPDERDQAGYAPRPWLV